MVMAVRVVRLTQSHPGQTPGRRVLAQLEVLHPCEVNEYFLGMVVQENGMIRVHGTDWEIPQAVFSIEYALEEQNSNGEWVFSHPLNPCLITEVV